MIRGGETWECDLPAEASPTGARIRVTVTALPSPCACGRRIGYCLDPQILAHEWPPCDRFDRSSPSDFVQAIREDLDRAEDSGAFGPPPAYRARPN